jgi:hypothetical protein
MPVATNTAVATYNFYTSHKTAAILNLGRHSEKFPQTVYFYRKTRVFLGRSGWLVDTDFSWRRCGGSPTERRRKSDQALRIFCSEGRRFRGICAVGGPAGTYRGRGRRPVGTCAENLRQILPILPKHFHHVLRWRLLLHILKPKVAYLRNPASSYWLNIINLSPHTRSKHQFATNTAVAAQQLQQTEAE